MMLSTLEAQEASNLLEQGCWDEILYHTILYYTILYYTILYYTILYYTILYYTILYYTILYYTILYYTILYYTLLYYSIGVVGRDPVLTCFVSDFGLSPSIEIMRSLQKQRWLWQLEIMMPPLLGPRECLRLLRRPERILTTLRSI